MLPGERQTRLDSEARKHGPGGFLAAKDKVGSEDEVITVLLHDAIEDTEEVARIVDGCSDAARLPKPPRREWKEACISHVKSAASPSVRLVSSADKLHNARAILADCRAVGEDLWNRFRGGGEGTL